MLKKGERICPVCGKRLRLRAPSNRDADGKDIREGYPCGAVRTRWSILPYTIYPHREHRIVRTRCGPYYISANSIERELRSDGLSLFNPFLVFFCEECSSRLSLNFNPHGLMDGLLGMLTLVLPLFIMVVIMPELLKNIWVALILALYAAVLLFWAGCMAYVKLFLSNFVPVDEYDALMKHTTELTLEADGLSRKFLHVSNVFTTQLSGRRFCIYLAEKTPHHLLFSICGENGEQKEFLRLLNGVNSLELWFEGKRAGTARVVSAALEETE